MLYILVLYISYLLYILVLYVSYLCYIVVCTCQSQSLSLSLPHSAPGQQSHSMCWNVSKYCMHTAGLGVVTKEGQPSLPAHREQ